MADDDRHDCDDPQNVDRSVAVSDVLYHPHRIGAVPGCRTGVSQSGLPSYNAAPRSCHRRFVRSSAHRSPGVNPLSALPADASVDVRRQTDAELADGARPASDPTLEDERNGRR